METLKRVLFVLGCLTMVPASAYAQASIAGVVRDTSGAVLPGATVEASSPVLIERVRSAVSDGSGQYRIVDLRAGTYTVTFALSGFSTLKRDGVELTGIATTTINAELRVGTLSETITVTAETPVVDVQSVRRQTTVPGDILNVLPTARGYGAVMQLIPSLTTQASFTPGARDVQVAPGMQVFGGQGGRENEGRLQVDGIGTGAPVNGGGVSGYIADVTNAQEVAFTTSGGLGEAEVGGPTMTIIPKTGGNTIKGTVYAAGVSNGMVSTNFTPELQAAGLSVPGELLKLWDFSLGVGGPVLKDRLWYFGNVRNEGTHRSVPGMYANINAGDPTKRTYVPDLTRQSVSPSAYQIQNLRLTIQATPRNKISLFWDEQIPCNGATWSADVDGCRRQSSSGFIYGGTATIAPEAGGTGSGGTSGGYAHKFQRVQQATWSSPVTSRFLVEAGFGTYLARYGSNEVPGNPTRDMVRVTEQCTAGCAVNGNIPNLIYRAHDWEYNWNGAHRWHASGSYVTGAHSMKFGYDGAFLAYEPMAFTNNLELAYQVNNGVPNQLSQTLNPFERFDHVKYGAVFGQEQWTYRRMTLQGALRYDHASSVYPEQRVGGTRFLPTPIVFPRTDGVAGFNDVTARVGVAYDVFGNGKTSLKVNTGRYLEAAAALGVYSAPNPVTRIATAATRAWTDANGNFVPDCDLLNPALQDLRTGGGDFCAALSNQNFGKAVFSNTIDADILQGSGTRGADWQIGASVQQELLPRVSVEVGYFRRWLQNFLVTDNLSVLASDFNTFSVTAPLDVRLPGGGGYVVSDLYNVIPTKFGQTNNYVTSDATIGEQYQKYNGLMVNLSARPRNGLTLQGGVNTGKTVTDNCAIRAQLPEVGVTNPYCHNAPGLVTRASGLAAYTIPRIDVLVSGTFRTDPGLVLAANYAVPSALVAQSLGRPVAGNVANVTVNLAAPGSVWGDRVNELDLRVAKILRFGRTRTNVGFDLYNVLNSSAVLNSNQTFIPNGSWLRPTLVLTSRFAKISATVDF